MKDVYVYWDITGTKYGNHKVAITRDAAMKFVTEALNDKNLAITEKSRENAARFIEGSDDHVELWALKKSHKGVVFTAIEYIAIIEKAPMVEQ